MATNLYCVVKRYKKMEKKSEKLQILAFDLAFDLDLGLSTLTSGHERNVKIKLR